MEDRDLEIAARDLQTRYACAIPTGIPRFGAQVTSWPYAGRGGGSELDYENELGGWFYGEG
ncbi:hypothetical protein JTE90_029689, partial [Oedothorax gibbosus]